MSAAFLRERERLMSEIAESLGRFSSNLNALNRATEAINDVGMQFGSVSELWQQLQHGIERSEELIQPKSEDVDGTTQQLAGLAVAPGGGRQGA